MAKYEVHMLEEDLERDDCSEVLVEFYVDGDLEYAVSVSSSNRDGVLDRVSGDDDVNSVSADEQSLINLATAFRSLTQ